MGGVGDEKLYEPYYKAIAECCDYAAEKGMGISVKPHGGLNATGPQCRKTVEFVGHKNFGIWYDPGNIFYYSDGKLNPVDDAPTVDGLVMGMSVKDFKPPKNVDVTPGTGKVDFPAVFAKLKAGGFTSGPSSSSASNRATCRTRWPRRRRRGEFLENLTGQKPQRVQGRAATMAPLQAGVAVADITPPIGYRMCGYFNERLSTGVLNPLHAKALVLRQGDTRAAMVFCDLIGLSRRGLEAGSRAGRAGDRHPGGEHSACGHAQPHGPAVLRRPAGPPAREGRGPARQGPLRAGGLSVAAGCADRRGNQGGRCQGAAGRGGGRAAQQQGLSFNRRFHMKDGTVRFNPGVLNPDIVRAAGPIDPNVGVVLFRDGRNALRAL